MLLLAFESSAKAASAALLRDGSLFGEYFQRSGQTHSRTLLKMADDLLNNCDLSADDLDAVAVAAGPGSFTGLRIGIAAAKGIAWGRELPCVGVSTTEAMARGAYVQDGVIAAVMDARREQVYCGIFDVTDGAMTRLAEDRAISVEQLGEELKKLKKTKFLVGDGASLCYNTLQKKRDLLLLPEHLRDQRAAGVALCAWDVLQTGERPSAAALKPNYIRLSQAERERANKLKK
ncbi:MAG: tRNA (adenosine(37)-N6)-threonylcarbamoyltransferase complex dimerization subunit type 1 TsaB [Oscillospiraceae bacterium]|nr:tRNA (adenosine(37)-N6)-threonylcarbamoyltransferase complex dimerization subunit type 1 TsaB [Oscillospiraceae bacterium]